MTFRLTREAEEDILAIYRESFDRFGVDQAERYYLELTACFGLLASQPQMARLRAEFDPPLRAHFHSSHVITYIEAEAGILILRLFHARQDWRHLI